MSDDRGIFTLANGVTLLRLLLTWPAGYLIITGVGTANVAALAIFLGAALSDGLDGYLARSRNETSKVGQLLDPVVDKVLGITVFAALVLKGALPAWALWVLVGKETLLLLGGLFMLGVRKDVVAARSLGKVTTVVLFFGIALILAGFGSVGRSLTLVGVALSVVAGVDYAILALRSSVSAGKA